jgi:hypothetical protein
MRLMGAFALLRSGAPLMGSRPDSMRVSEVLVCCAAQLVLLSCFLSGMVCPCIAQGRDVLCTDGTGGFQAQFQSTGVSVRVGAARRGELAIRRCAAVLSWKKQTLAVVTSASQVDMDAFGVDMGLDVPVVAFQVRESADDCCMEYQIYSLKRPPRLLQTISGGDYFSAADTDLDGRVEIWTDDASAIDGFEGLSLAEFDNAPTIVLRFSDGKLVEVSPEFQPYFDHEIAGLREELSQNDLRDFRASDGRLASHGPLSVEQLHHLRGIKVKVLEIVWSYLYSGREQEAWRALDEMWPAADIARIRTGILNLRARGVSAKIGGSSPAELGGRKKHAKVFDVTNESLRGEPGLVPPRAIILNLPPEMGSGNFSPSQSVLNLVIDSAGKVRSAEPAGVDPALIYAALGWKFIPAMKNGRAVACRLRLSVSPKQ